MINIDDLERMKREATDIDMVITGIVSNVGDTKCSMLLGKTDDSPHVIKYMNSVDEDLFCYLRSNLDEIIEALELKEEIKFQEKQNETDKNKAT